MNGGRTWQYIKQNILADQRNSGYLRIYYDYVPDTVAAVINKASQLLLTDCDDCHRQALQHLLNVGSDPRAHNALGVALYLCGRPEEALPYFRSAAANGNEDAKNNLEQIEKNVK
jgi:TPR repeat protein